MIRSDLKSFFSADPSAEEKLFLGSAPKAVVNTNVSYNLGDVMFDGICVNPAARYGYETSERKWRHAD